MTLENPTDLISLAVVKSKYLPNLSTETIERMCRKKIFKTACKPGGTPFSHWRVQRIEVQSHVYRNNTSFLAQ